MRPRSLGRYLLSISLSISAAWLLAGCGNPQPPIVGPAANAQANTMASIFVKSHDLIYAADGEGSVEIVSYPAGEKVGSIYYGLYSYLGGECADRAGNVWITDYSTIEEYPHGGSKPIWENFAKWYLTGCSIAPKTNDVAAVGQSGTVFIWSNGRGKAKVYHTRRSYTLRYCGYDAGGDLFVDGFDPRNNNDFLFFELPSGGSKLVRVTLDKKIRGAGQVQWDGKYVAIQDTAAPYDIYRVTVSGNTGTVVNTIAFDGLRKRVAASWIVGATVLIPYSVDGRFTNGVGIFDYPEGGKPIGILHGKTYKYVIAVTLSK